MKEQTRLALGSVDTARKYLKMYLIFFLMLSCVYAESPIAPTLPPECGPNEHLERDSNRCQITCDNMDIEHMMGACVTTDACFCDGQYVRDKSGVCISRDQCPKIVCKDPNEVITDCYTPCADRKCIDRIKGSNISCIAACIATGCICKPDYYRHDNGTCVPVHECSPPRCDECEEYNQCGSSCPDTCDNKGNTCIICTKECVEGCFCKKNTVRADDGSCIDPEKCPKPVCDGANEYFDWCPPNCPHQNCSAIWSRIDCTNASTCCKPQCRCIDGYYRNRRGICISSKECILESNCPPNSWFNTCGTSCPLTCDEPKPRPCDRMCNPGCECDEGYVKDKDGNCIKPEDCPKKVVCKDPNEVLTDCYTVCADKTCRDRIKGSGRGCHTACIETGCICKEGFYRHDNGTCVPLEQCSPPRCNDDEEYQECGTACPVTCKNNGDTCTACTQQCVEGCFCKNNTVRADDGSCISPKECPEPVCSGPNEHFDWCPPNCPHENCSIIWSRIDCTNASKCCKPQCRCISGHFRNSSGICITGKECTNGAQCGPHSWFNSCGTACPLTCDEPNPRPCTKQCNPGCQCDDGYIQDKDGNCIKPEECPQSQCGANQTYVQCKFSCPTDYCKESNGPDPQCLPQNPCPPGCRCKPGYLKRHEDGECINKTDCPPTVICEEGEHFERCGTACPPRCDNMKPQSCTEQCVRGCFCDDGLVRDHLSGKCVPPEKCPTGTVCDKNEHFEDCGTACPPTCDNPNPQICTDQCVTGCFCDKGLLRDKNSGKCVPPKKCTPRKCRDDEEYQECGTACPETCDNRGNTCRACITVCVKGCFCKKGLVRDANGRCIPPKDCPQPVCTGQNEHFDWCPPNCPHQNCSAIWSRIDCRNASDCCNPQCRCIDGYYRNDSGICVSIDECIHGISCGPNSHFNDCGSACPLTCEEPEPRPCTRQCVAGCVCDDGFVKDKDGNCIKPDECPKSQCGANQTYVQCQFDCPTDYCKESDAPVPVCSPPYPCPPGCRCKPGYLKRRVDGECVKETDCPPPVICGEGEHFERCGTACPPTCNNPNPQICTAQCVIGCFCDKGLLRDEKSGKCVPPKKCPPRQCGDDEEYQKCGTACPETCDNRGNTCRACITVCVEGCFCKKGLVRDANGCCIPPKDCPQPVCTGQNEHFDWCPPNCPHQNCSAIWSRIDCRNASDCCNPQCRCIDGYYRNDSGICVSIDECIHGSSCGPNSHFNDCGSACPSTCEEPEPRSCTRQCVAGCVCDDGFVKDKDGNCIKPDECPKSQCGANQTYVQCQFDCPTDYCKESDAPVPVCSPPYPCPPGCRCKPGYLKRRVDGECVKETDCPPPVICGEGEHFERCGTACPPTCDNPNPQICTAQCVIGCFCDKGLLRDEKSGKCVPPKKCPPRRCNDDEEYQKCGTACPETCENRGDTCRECTEQCVKGCFCKKGTVRAADGSCIPPKKCPKPVCKGPNEYFDWCPPNCPPQSCSDIWSNYDCSKASKCCKPRCRCNDGYFRNNKGICVSINDCLCGDKSHYSECGSACPLTCDDPNSRACTLQCVKGCECDEGFVRDSDKRCIKPEECPPRQCRDDEEWVKCGLSCERTCDNPKPIVCTTACVDGCVCKGGRVRDEETGKCVDVDDCPIVCDENETCNDVTTVCPPQTCDSLYTIYDCPNVQGGPGCDCIDGYLRNGTVDDPCIPSDQCPPPESICPDNEEWDDCGTGCPVTCRNKDKPIICLAVCVQGCFCKRGLVRNDEGLCIPPKECKPPVCPANEEWKSCGSACPLSCNTRDNPVPCPAVCVQGCFCKKGLIRNNKGLCVPPDQCPPSCPINEEWQSCGSACPSTCKTLNAAVSCPAVCVEGCFCRDGLVRNDEGNCIPPEQCPTCPVNEEWRSCGSACPATCKSRNETVYCPAVCVEGCFCNDGLIRNDEGVCVPSDQCPPIVCPKNEEWHDCGFACPSTCDSINKSVICPAVCRQGCFCNKGLVRNADRICVPPEQCPIKCKANEVYSDCRYSCPPQVCAAPYTDYACPLEKICEPGCNCIQEYLRNGTANDPCIPSDQCPPPIPSCPVNEEYKSCGSACTSSCNTTYDIDVTCITVCLEGCFCKSGFLRDNKGVCVRPDQCPKQCPENEEWNSCGTACPKTCKNKDLQIKCIAACKEGCFCKDGLVRNDEGICVHPKQCPPRCKANEVYSNCSIVCPPQTCASIYTSYLCNNNTTCKPGCNCIDEYLRNGTADDPCIPSDQCPPPTPFCPENEEWKSCGSACPKTCKNKNLKINCIAVCKEGCFCKSGLVRNDDGICVHPKQCGKLVQPQKSN